MARLSVVEQLQKAIERGDLEGAKVLAEKIKQQEKPKPKAKPKKQKPQTEPEPEPEIFKTAKSTSRRVKPAEKDEDGNVRARSEPFRPIKRPNLFSDSGKTHLADLEFDKKVQRKG